MTPDSPAYLTDEAVLPDGERPRPHVAILMATYQGAKYLSAQLDSIETQSFGGWTLHVSDDGSSDGTREILAHYQRRWGEHRLQWQEGPRSGFAHNFLSLLCNPDIRADYYAFADQDDIWLPDKLERAVAALGRKPSDTPALYCSRTRLMNHDGEQIGLSPGLRRPPAFANALVQNIASGNTMVFNRTALEQAASAGPQLDIPLHDWWLYLVTSGCGGYVYFSDEPGLLYRQHGSNVIGMRLGLRALPSRLRRLFLGEHHLQIKRNLAALQLVREALEAENRRRFDAYLASRQASGLKRLARMHAAGVYRQTTLGQLAMLAASIFNKT